MNSIFDQEISFSKKLFLSFLFALAYAQSPLFSSNQNTYFLHGLADSNQGLLGSDWMANTADPFPVFSFFVEQTSAYFPNFFFHIYYLIVLGIFMYSALGIGVEALQLSRQRLLAYFLLITGLFSLLFSFASAKLLGTNLSHLFQNGLAGQYALGTVLQPSTSGVFLFSSVYLFLKDKRILSILALAFAVNIHATYLLSAAFLTLAYIMILWTKQNKKDALILGGLSLLVALPNLLYSYSTFASQPAESVLAAQKILVDIRIPHHTKVSSWFGIASAFQISLMLAAMFFIRKNKEMFIILTVPFSLAAALTLFQVFTESYFLALIFPWRVSVLLVPLSVLVLSGKFIEEASQRQTFAFMSPKALRISFFVALFAFVITGVSSFALQHKNDAKRKSQTIEQVVMASKTPSSIYLVPPRLERFRLGTEAAIFVDKKTHPYKADEVKEWYRRLVLAEGFYKNADADCELLEMVMVENKLTHVVDERTLNCSFLAPIRSDGDFKLFRRTTY